MYCRIMYWQASCLSLLMCLPSTKKTFFSQKPRNAHKTVTRWFLLPIRIWQLHDCKMVTILQSIQFCWHDNICKTIVPFPQDEIALAGLKVKQGPGEFQPAIWKCQTFTTCYLVYLFLNLLFSKFCVFLLKVTLDCILKIFYPCQFYYCCIPTTHVQILKFGIGEFLLNF